MLWSVEIQAGGFDSQECALFATMVEMIDRAKNDERQDVIDRFMIGAMGKRRAMALVARAINFTRNGGTGEAAWMQCGGA